MNYNWGMLVNFLLGLLGVILFLFIFWKRLKEDYSSDVIFQVASAILVAFSLGLLIAKLFIPAWFFWISFLTTITGMALMVYKFKLRVYETVEAFIMAILPFISLMFFKDSITRSSLPSFLAFVTSLILIFVVFWLDLNYKNLSWYKSGKIGFAGIMTAILFFLLRTVIAIFGINMISFVGQIDIVLSVMMVLICTGGLIILGRVKE